MVVAGYGYDVFLPTSLESVVCSIQYQETKLMSLSAGATNTVSSQKALHQNTGFYLHVDSFCLTYLNLKL